jgi:chromosome partitioning protein
MTRIIAVCNQKGGVAKTTTTANLGYGLAYQGKKVLLIDLDPQAALTYTFLNDNDRHFVKGTSLDMLQGNGLPLYPIKCDNGRLELVPSDIELAGAEMGLQGEPGRDFLLRSILRKMAAQVEPFDYIFIDCPPTLGLLTINALAAANSILIPVAAEGLPLIGLAQLLDTLDVVRERLNPGLEVEGILLTRNKKRVNLSREVFDELSRDFGSKLYKTRISENVSLAEAPMHHKTIWQHAGGSIGASDYGALVDEFQERDFEARVEAPLIAMGEIKKETT